MQLINYVKKLILCMVLFSGFRNGYYSLEVPVPDKLAIRDKISERSMWGDIALSSDYAFLVNILVSKDDYCAGTLISAEWVLTAAQCLVNSDFLVVMIGAGLDFTNPSPTSVLIPSRHWVIHEHFESTGDNIALVKLSRPVAPNEYVRIALYAKGGDYVNRTGVTIAWPMNERSSDRLLRKHSSRIISNDECRSKLAGKMDIGPGHLCLAGGHSPSCDAAVGTPLIVNQVIIGIKIGPTFDCDEFPEVPVVFTRVSHYKEWIAKNSAYGNLRNSVQFQLLCLVFVKLYVLYTLK